MMISELGNNALENDDAAQESAPREAATPAKTAVILEFLHDLRSDPQADAFAVPVDWRQLGIPDYPSIVKHPMDLRTLEEKVRGEHVDEGGQRFKGYTYCDEFLADLALVWSNCKLFNQIGSSIYRCAHSMERLSSRLLAKYKLVESAPTEADPELVD